MTAGAVYLDHHATTPPLPAVLRAMADVHDHAIAAAIRALAPVPQPALESTP